eukprot:14223386-Alexandrium_andersonii.AAC.1
MASGGQDEGLLPVVDEDDVDAEVPERYEDIRDLQWWNSIKFDEILSAEVITSPLTTPMGCSKRLRAPRRGS